LTPIELCTVQEIIDHLRTRFGSFVFLGATAGDNETAMAGKHQIVRAVQGTDPDQLVLADRLRDIVVHEVCARTQYKAESNRAVVEDVARAMVSLHMLKNTTLYNNIIPLEGYK
jgi:hypothetical protein